MRSLVILYRIMVKCLVYFKTIGDFSAIDFRRMYFVIELYAKY